MSDNILDQIDAAIADRCAHCGRPLAPGGPSAWWCNEACQENWQASRAGQPIPDAFRREMFHPTIIQAVDALRDPSQHIDDQLDPPPIPAPDTITYWRQPEPDPLTLPALVDACQVLLCPAVDPRNPTVAELAAGIPIELPRPEPGHYLADAIAKATATTPAGRLGRAWRRIRTTLGGNR
jgi:hypothetical protein